MLDKAYRQYRHSTRLDVMRGTIFDRNFDELAVTINTFSVYAHPRKIEDKLNVAKSLSKVMQIDADKIHSILKRNRSFVWLARKIGDDAAKKIRSLKISGVGLKHDAKRVYPKTWLAGHLLGFMGQDRGLEGLELKYNTLLEQDSTQVRGLRDAHGNNVYTEGVKKRENGEMSLVLTLDSRVQFIAESALEEVVTIHRAKSGMAVVLDTQTSQILAAANFPKFNPNAFKKHKSGDWRNRVIADAFEPGSTIKPFVVAEALDRDLVDLDTIIDTGWGRMKLGRHTIRDTHPSKELSVKHVISESSNIGVSRIAFDMGAETVFDLLKKYGFGNKLNLGLPGESSGILHPPKGWSKVRLANVSFGQGMMATPMQIAAAYLALANGGIFTKPQLLLKTVDSEARTIHDFSKQVGSRVLSEDAAKQVTEALAEVVRTGSGKRLKIPGLSIAAKTGTSQKVDPKTRAYSDALWMSSVVGFAPAENPRLVVAVFIDEPEYEHYGAVVAGPAFKKILEDSLTVLGLSTQGMAQKSEIAALSKNATPLASKQAASNRRIHSKSNKKLDTALDGVFQATLAKRGFLPPIRGRNEQQSASTERIPNFEGLSMREVMRLAPASACKIKITGSGLAVNQYPLAGSFVSRQTECGVHFEALW